MEELHLNWRRVLLDVCTQNDYLGPGGLVQVVNRESVVENLRDIFRWTQTNRVPVVSAMESHRRSELANGFPLHCIDGTPGQKKLPFTLIPPTLAVEADNYLSLPPDIMTSYRQLVFRKRTREFLSNPKADRFLTQLPAEEFIIVGVGLERTIKPLALGLLARHKPKVTVISDACGYWSSADADLTARQLAAKGVQVLKTAELIVPPPVVAPVSSRSRRSRTRHASKSSSRKRKSSSDVA